ncbi:MAG: acyl dehydratase [Propionibacteriales bacterium]|nr:acyl dehydratase [Propionibacteriales bacterium]
MTASDAIREGDVLREVVRTPDAVDLFQFSAAIWLTHRIHYDSPYTTEVENHPAMPVQGPLQAVYLAQLVRRDLERRRPSCLVQVRRYRFRHTAPAYVDQTLRCQGTVTEVDGDRVTCEVWAEVDGRQTTVGQVEVVLRENGSGTAG